MTETDYSGLFRDPCNASAPDGLRWLSPPAVCALPKGHTGGHDDLRGACWTDGGSFGVRPSRYFGREEAT